MEKCMKAAYWNMVCLVMTVKSLLIGKMVKLRTEGASHFIEILVAIIIVIALGAIFKTQIVNFITAITSTATTKANDLF